MIIEHYSSEQTHLNLLEFLINNHYSISKTLKANIMKIQLKEIGLFYQRKQL